MKGKTSVGSDRLFENYQEIHKFATWDDFHYAMVTDYDSLPLAVYINKTLHFLVQKQEKNENG